MVCRLFALLFCFSWLVSSCGLREHFAHIPIPPPSLQLFVASQPTEDPCFRPPETHAFIGSRLVPIDYCLLSYDSVFQKPKLCLKVNDGSTPSPTDECFKPKIEFEKLALLRNGLNTVSLFALGEKNEMLESSGEVVLNIGSPPNIDLILPLSSSFSSVQWRAGEHHLLRWKISDDDTQFPDIKVIFSLVNKSTGVPFKHLACNFKNSSLWKQCPLPEIENSGTITRNETLQTFDFDFIVPSDFDAPKEYVITVTAIDKSGNAMVTSTPEVNAKWEVLAGRTYSGVGGSGSTLQRNGETPILAVDKKGQLFITNENFKINAFDLRTCRYFRPSEAIPSSNDCADVIDTGAFAVNTQWVYVPDRDFFIAGASRKEGAGTIPYIVSIDFSNRKITPIVGGAGNPLPTSLTKNVKGLDVSASGMSAYLAYEKVSKRIFFKINSQIFSLDSNGLISYEFGSVAMVANPVNQDNQLPENLDIPSGQYQFIVTEDGRFYFWGAKRPTHEAGGIYSLQYVVEKSNDGALYSLKTTSFDGDNRSLSYSIQPYYDSDTKTLYSNFAWNGFAKMAFPKRSSDAIAYKWEPIMEQGGTTSLNALLDGDEANSENAIPANQLPRRAVFLSYGMTRANSTTLILSDRNFGYVFGYDLKTNRTFRLVGFPVGLEGDQLAINRRLDTPRWLFVDNKGDTVFSDYHNFHKVSTSGTPNYQITSLPKGKLVPLSPFAYSSTRNEIIQLAVSDSQNSLRIFNAGNFNTPTYERVSPIASLQYHLAFAFSNDFLNPKVHMRGSSWVQTGVGVAYMKEVQKASSSHLTVADQYPLGHSGCGGSGCQQVSPLSQDLYQMSDFRLASLAGRSEWRDPIGHWAYTADDKYVIGCLKDAVMNQERFVRMDKQMNRLLFFEVKDSEGTILLCSEVKSLFNQAKGVVYTSVNNKFYSLDLTLVETQRRATATLVPNVGIGAPGQYGSFVVRDEGIYYTEMNSGRLLRNNR